MVKSKDETRRKYKTEDEARSSIIARLSGHFEFFEEASAEGPDGDVFRLDAISRCLYTGVYIGWEFKRSALYMQEFAPSLRQAIHYRLSTINDRRIPDLHGKQLPAIAVFPDWEGEHDEDCVNYQLEARGMRILAAQFRVGAMREEAKDQIRFYMGNTGIWRSDQGWNKNAPGVLFGKRGFGANRRADKTVLSEAAQKKVEFEKAINEFMEQGPWHEYD